MSAITPPTTTPPVTASVVTISYHDLALFDPFVDSPSNNALIDQIGKAFGRPANSAKKNDHGNDDDDDDSASLSSSLGILAVQDIPHFVELRRRLLPLAARLPTLPDLQDIVLPETLYSTGWSHGKEVFNGKPDVAKGSFYANPLHDSLLRAMIQRHHLTTANDSNISNSCDDHDDDVVFVQDLTAHAQRHPEFYADNVWPQTSLPELRPAFMDLGRVMVETGRLVAAVCDAYCAKQQERQQQGNDDSSSRNNNGGGLQLCKTLTKSLNCKGRLLHYFPVVQQQHESSSLSSSTAATITTTAADDDLDENLWCGWHNDHVS
jgi:hypothetical protein